MMTPSTGAVGAAADRHEAIGVLLDDPEWLDAEFEAVLRASGLITSSRIVMVSSPPDPPSSLQPDLPLRCSDIGVPIHARAVARIRSPPPDAPAMVPGVLHLVSGHHRVARSLESTVDHLHERASFS